MQHMGFRDDSLAWLIFAMESRVYFPPFLIYFIYLKPILFTEQMEQTESHCLFKYALYVYID